MMAERQKIIETNRSIRTIKNELESLLEKDVISYESYQSVHALLPAEASLSGAAKVASPPPPPTDALANLNLHNAAPTAHAPPSYAQTTGAAPPALPTRNGGSAAAAAPPPLPPPSKPVIAHARALYSYKATDARDVSFERDDPVAVYEFMNADWWMGRNERTGQEGIFPRTYVEQLPGGPPPGPGAGAGAHYAAHNEKAAAAGGMMYGSPAPGAPQYGGYPPPPQQQNPYNSSVPPMAVANEEQQQQQGGGGGKAGEMGKKFGKKLGNAAIFGAGASIGSNIVNSIF